MDITTPPIEMSRSTDYYCKYPPQRPSSKLLLSEALSLQLVCRAARLWLAPILYKTLVIHCPYPVRKSRCQCPGIRFSASFTMFVNLVWGKRGRREEEKKVVDPRKKYIKNVVFRGGDARTTESELGIAQVENRIATRTIWFINSLELGPNLSFHLLKNLPVVPREFRVHNPMKDFPVAVRFGFPTSEDPPEHCHLDNPPVPEALHITLSSDSISIHWSFRHWSFGRPTNARPQPYTVQLSIDFRVHLRSIA
jgi:hypothetical protein